MQENNYEVIIIGAGPAGISAAIYFKRAGINPLIIEKSAPGGTLNKTSKIDNYPGYTDKDGATLAFRMYSQIEELGVDLKIEEVVNIEESNDSFVIKTNNNEYKTKYVLIGTGKTPRKLDVKDASNFEGIGISYCAICDGALYKGRDIAIVGGGNSAMEAASYMSSIANKIYIINRSSILRADKKEQDEVLKKENVEVLFNSKIVEFISKEDKLTGIKLSTEKELNVEGIFVCIGQEPNYAYYQNLGLNTDDKGIIVDNNMKTSKDGIYAVGDAISKDLYQVVNAVSEGAVAATNIIKQLKDN